MTYLTLENISPFAHLGPSLNSSQQETRILIKDTYRPKREDPGVTKLDGRCQGRKEGPLTTEYLFIVEQFTMHMCYLLKIIKTQIF